MKYIDTLTIKIGIAASISVFITNKIGLEFGATAGIISILSMQKTKMQTFKIGFKRFIAALIAIILSFVIYVILGNSALTFGLFLLVYIPITNMLKLEVGLVLGAVLSTHLLVSSNINFNWILNEIALTVIGIGVASIFNLYVPSLTEKFDKDKEYIEEQFRIIILNMAKSLTSHTVPINEEKIFIDLECILNKNKNRAYRINENYLFQDKSYYIDYIEMRIKQFYVIKKMRKHFFRFYMTYTQTKMMAELTENIAINIHSDNDCIKLLNSLQELKEEYKNMELPITREEFENRAMLFQYLNDMEDFLNIKRAFKEKWRDN